MRRQSSIQQQQQQAASENSIAATHRLRPVRISSLGGLSIHVHGRDINVQGWKSPKVYQLLSLIVAMGGKNIAVHQISDAIWGDVEGDKGMQNLEFILRRLRQVIQPDLGDDLSATQVFQLQHGKISVNADYCDMDIWQWESLCAQAKTLRRQGDRLKAVVCEQQAGAMLAGGFLAGDDVIELVGRQRSTWRSRACTWIADTMTQWRNDEQLDVQQIMDLFDVWQHLDPSSERLCMQRMQLLLDEGYSVDAMRCYYAWVQLIRDQYGLKPSTQAIALSNRIAKTKIQQ